MKYNESDLENLATRVHRLETQNRRRHLATAVLGLSMISVLLLAAKQADQPSPKPDPKVIRATAIEAQDFILKDTEGHTRARLTVSPSPRAQGPMIRKLPPDARSYVLESEGPSLQFFDERGELIWAAPQKPRVIPTK